MLARRWVCRCRRCITSLRPVGSCLTGCAPSSCRKTRFAEKLKDIVGLYVDPPARAVVLLADEKSQIQALDRTHPGLLMKKGRAGTMQRHRH